MNRLLTASDLLSMADELADMYIELANLKIELADPIDEFDKNYMANNADRLDRPVMEAKIQIMGQAAKKQTQLNAQILMLEAKIRGAELRFDAVKMKVISRAK